MVLWEIALGTAYFLGLKRTYKLALRAQRKVISRNHPKIRGIVQGRIRYVFDMALTVHQKIQGRDLDVGRNIGNWILKCLDKAKPSAQIRPHLPHPGINTNATILAKTNQVNKTMDKDSRKRLFTNSRGFWPKSFPTISNFMKPMRRRLPSSSDINGSATNVTMQGNNIGKKWDRESGKRLFTAARSYWPKHLSAINNFLKPMRSNVQSRPYSSSGVQHFTVNYGKFRSGDVVRNDIRQWIRRN